MCSAILATIDWFKVSDAIALWAEGIALILIFIWDRKHHKEDHAETVKQTKLMKDQATQQLRAYLCIADSLVKFTDDGAMEAQLYLQNGGQTPAYSVKGWSDVIIREYPLAQPLSRPDGLLKASGIIPPQDKHIIIAKKFSAPDIVMRSIETKAYAFYVYGEAVYEDIFRKSHRLEFRLIYGGPAGTRTKLDTNGVKCGLLCMDMEGNEERDTYPQPLP